MKKIILPVIILLTTSLVFADNDGAKEMKIKSLVGIESFAFSILHATIPQEIDFNANQLQTKLEPMLREKGITILPLPDEKTAITDGIPILCLVISAEKASDLQMYAFNISIGFLQSVSLKRDPEINTSAITWRASFVFASKTDDISINIQIIAQDLVDMFITDYFTANPILSRNSILPLQSQFQTGMTTAQVLELYGYGIDSNTSTVIPKFTRPLIKKYQDNECENQVYRYWLNKNGVASPFLLTFQSCRLPNYDSVQKERKQKIDNGKKIVKSSPELQQEIARFIKENQLTEQDRELVIELLATNNELPQCMTDATLIHIQADERHKSVKK